MIFKYFDNYVTWLCYMLCLWPWYYWRLHVIPTFLTFEISQILRTISSLRNECKINFSSNLTYIWFFIKIVVRCFCFDRETILEASKKTILKANTALVSLKSNNIIKKLFRIGFFLFGLLPPNVCVCFGFWDLKYSNTCLVSVAD